MPKPCPHTITKAKWECLRYFWFAFWTCSASNFCGPSLHPLFWGAKMVEAYRNDMAWLFGCQYRQDLHPLLPPDLIWRVTVCPDVPDSPLFCYHSIAENYAETLIFLIHTPHGIKVNMHKKWSWKSWYGLANESANVIRSVHWSWQKNLQK